MKALEALAVSSIVEGDFGILLQFFIAQSHLVCCSLQKISIVNHSSLFYCIKTIS